MLWRFGTGTLATTLFLVNFPVIAAGYDVPVMVAFLAATAPTGSLPVLG